MGRYKAERARERGETTIEDLSMRTVGVLHRLQKYPYYWEHKDEPRLLDRTANGHHYRMVPGLASVLGIEVVRSVGDHGTEPPTELGRVGDTLSAIDKLAHNWPEVCSAGLVEVIHIKLEAMRSET